MAYYCSFKPSLLFLLFLTATAQARNSITTHLHFFYHEKYSNPNATAIIVVNSTTSNPGGFGSISVADDEIREGLSIDSKLIGRAQTLAPVVSQSGQTTFLVLIDFFFTDGKYNGSSLMVLGRATFEGATERSIIGGTGKFRMARGYTINTFLSGAPEGRLVAEYDAYIVH